MVPHRQLRVGKQVPLAAVLLGDDEEGLLCVRKTPGAMG